MWGSHEYAYSTRTVAAEIAQSTWTGLSCYAQPKIQQAIAGCAGLDFEYGGAITTHMVVVPQFEIQTEHYSIWQCPCELAPFPCSCRDQTDDLDALDELDDLLELVCNRHRTNETTLPTTAGVWTTQTRADLFVAATPEPASVSN